MTKRAEPKSDKIRELLTEGKSVAEVARETKSHYSFVYSVKQRMASTKPLSKPRGIITMRKLTGEKDPTTPEPRTPAAPEHPMKVEQAKRRAARLGKAES